MFLESIKLFRDKIIIIDQTLLPSKELELEIINYREMIEAIKKLRIRGAPALGVAAAATAYLAAKEFHKKDDFITLLLKAIDEIEESRPTAVNLFLATEKIKKIISNNENLNIPEMIFNFACELRDYEIEACEKMGKNGADFLGKPNLKILTHCNAGSLATVGIGTSLGVIRKIAERFKIQVFVDETRPLLQGARLTMWELMKSGVPCTLISDNMAASTILSEQIDCIITGADRIAVNGDTANKIGTFNLGILSKHFNIPFYIVAPETTIDKEILTGNEINIEQRNPDEVRHFHSVKTAPINCLVHNPAFDVTPAELISGIITDKKVYKFPYKF